MPSIFDRHKVPDFAEWELVDSCGVPDGTKDLAFEAFAGVLEKVRQWEATEGEENMAICFFYSPKKGASIAVARAPHHKGPPWGPIWPPDFIKTGQ